LLSESCSYEKLVFALPIRLKAKNQIFISV
jgi:hypothetical protein